ncbi:MAG TPA: serine/threonine-protein kinase [Polyangiaceae bacterium]|nr:serine/threonine-protein kinase [Polyangiaceae bacterium]
MKACPACGRLYPDDAGFCFVEGTRLGSATQVPVAPDEDDPRIGQLVCERYEIRRVVADGGMGRVYEALDLHERRSVALKVLHPDVARDPVAVERFKREFQVSSELPHEHIVEVYDFAATADATYALVMEFLSGEPLRATLKRERVISPARVVRMLSQIALGLDEAHTRRLVHRDLKPDNLFLCQTHDGDILKILDFGSVKDTGDNAQKLTMLGTTIGSPFYMSPEQAEGLDTLDRRADVWALAAITYECVTGQVPFRGNNGPSTLLCILTQEPKPASVAGAKQKYPVPITLDEALGRAFRKAPARRTPSAGAFADEVGHAYGLSGNHREWAKMREPELAELIDAALPSLLGAERQRARRISDAFFGEHGALDSGPPPASARDSATRQSNIPTVRPPAGAASGLPSLTPTSTAGRARTLVALGVGVCAVVVATVAALWMFR